MFYLENSIFYICCWEALCEDFIFNFYDLGDVIYVSLVHCYKRGLMRTKQILIVFGDKLFRLASPLIIYTFLLFQLKIRVFLCFPLATNCKKLVCASPSNNFLIFALWYHFISSSLRSCARLSFKVCFRLTHHHWAVKTQFSCLAHLVYQTIFFFLISTTDIFGPTNVLKEYDLHAPQSIPL